MPLPTASLSPLTRRRVFPTVPISYPFGTQFTSCDLQDLGFDEAQGLRMVEVIRGKLLVPHPVRGSGDSLVQKELAPTAASSRGLGAP